MSTRPKRHVSSRCRKARCGREGCLAAACLQDAGPAPLHAAQGPAQTDDEAALTQAILALATRHGRYGHRRITALLHAQSWCCNHERVEWFWHAKGLTVPARQPRRGRLWLDDGSCLRLRPDRPNPLWACDLVEDRTREGRKFPTLSVVDEFSRECLAIRAKRTPGSTEVIDVLTDLFVSPCYRKPIDNHGTAAMTTMARSNAAI